MTFELAIRIGAAALLLLGSALVGYVLYTAERKK
jgi:hypothetical protein